MTQQIIEELIITSSDYPEKIEMGNPHPSANVKFGKFDTTTGEKVSDENSFYPEAGYAKTASVGDGFTFDCYRGFSVSAYCSIHTRKFKVFIDGVFKDEVSYVDDESKADVRYSITFADYQKHTVTIVLTLDTLYTDYVYLTPANLPVLQNPGTVADYPVLEVESADTEAIFSPLGKTVGDADHPFTIWLGATPSLPDFATATASSREVTQDSYNKVSFLNGSTSVPGSVTAGNHVWTTLGCNLKALQSSYHGMPATEIKNHMQSILSEVWAYAKGAIEVGDPSFESGANGFSGLSGVSVSQSAEWAKTGTKSLKINNNGSSPSAIALKSYGNQAGKKIEAKVTIRDTVGGANIRVLWRDVTNLTSLSWTDVYIMSAGEEKDFELECTVPSDCTDIRLYIYPNILTTVANYICIDDVTVTAHGVELYCWSDTWTHLAGSDHTLDFPKLMSWLNNTDSLPYYINDGKITFLIKAKYPSDGISPSAAYIDHCRLGTVMTYAKLGADAITNYGGNLLENGWGEYFAVENYGQWGSPFKQYMYIHDGIKILNPGQEVTLSYEGRRDAEAVTNGISPLIFFIFYLEDGSYAGAVGSSDQFPAKANVWERTEQTVQLLDDYPMGEIVTVFYRFPNKTLPGKVEIRNAVLVAGDKIIYLGPQEKYIIGFTSEQTLAQNDILTIDGTALHAKKNDVSVVDSLSSTFSTNGFKLAPGLNHFMTSHIGGNMKIRAIKESMPKIAAFDGIYFPAVASIAKSKKKTGDKEETAGGKLRQDIVRIRRIWDVETGKLTKEEADELIDHLESKLYGSGDFWLAEFGGGGNTIEAYIDPNNLKEEIVPFGKDGWHPDGRRLSFQVEER